MKTLTRSTYREFLKEKLSTDAKWAIQAMVRVFEYQTATEQSREYTKDRNGVGYTPADARLLASFTKQWESKHFLSEKQIFHIKKRMPKYWRQVLEISDLKKLHSVMGVAA